MYLKLLYLILNNNQEAEESLDSLQKYEKKKTNVA